MADQFVGLQVKVVLKPPRKWVMFGLVAEVTQSSELHLTNVSFDSSSHVAEHLAVPGDQIEDIEVISRPPLPGSVETEQLKIVVEPKGQQNVTTASQLRNTSNSIDATVTLPLSAAQSTTSPLAAESQQGRYHDPAILSYEKTPIKPSAAKPQPQPPSNDSKLPATSNAFKNLLPSSLAQSIYGTSIPKTSASPPKLFTATQPPKPSGSPPKPTISIQSATQSIPVNLKPSYEKPATEHQPVQLDGEDTPMKRSRRKRRTKQQQAAASVDIDSSPELARVPPSYSTAPQNGWRETPILQEVSRGDTVTNTEHAKRNPRRNRRKQAQDLVKMNSGWATEDATDVQEMGDFDFAGNLAVFDKKTVFDQIKNEDTTADEDRLVTHNKVAKAYVPQTKKLLPSENVLQPKRQDSRDVSFENENDPTKMERSFSSRSSLYRSGPRKASVTPSDSSTPHARSFRGHANKSMTGRVLSPSPNGLASPATTIPGKRTQTMRYNETNRSCPTVDPELLRNIEDYAAEKFNISPDIITESAGRCIADIALSAINPGGRRLGYGNHNAQPVVVLLMADIRASARALVAARYMRERGIRVVACSLQDGSEKEEMELWTLPLQTIRFQSKIMSWDETSAYLKTLDAPPELIIDAMCGKCNSQYILDAENTTEPSYVTQDKTALSMMAWANKSRASVLSIELPSGIDPYDGTVKVHEGEPAEVRAKIVVCCGAPTTGLYKAMKMRTEGGYADDWRIHVCDIGIQSSLIKMTQSKSKGKPGKSIDFGGQWIVGIDYMGSDDS